MTIRDATAIPGDLRDVPQWVTWRYETRDGKRTKVPKNARGDGNAMSDTPATWCDFETALAAAQRRSDRDGIGFVLSPDDGFAGFDIDHCYRDGVIEPWAADIVTAMHSYTEITPGGDGLRVFFKATLPAAGKRRNGQGEGSGAIELYDRGRFLTTTGAHLAGTPTTIEERQAELDAIYAELWPTRQQEPRQAPRGDVSLDDAALLDKARGGTYGAEFRALYDQGDATAHAGNDSDRDWALLRHLHFWTGADGSRMDSLFRQSACMRPKWDEKRGDSTYGAISIANRIAAGGNTYRPSERAEIIFDDPPQSEQDDAHAGEGHDAPALPLLDAGDRQLPRIAAQSWNALRRHNSGPHLFRYGDVPTRIEAGADGQALLRAVTPDALRYELARAANWYADVAPTKGGAARRVDAVPPMNVVRDLLATPEPPLPVLRRLTTAPTFARDGSLRTERGYHDGIFFTGGLVVPAIPDRPTPAEIAAARDLLYEVLQDFPFAQPSDKAHAIGMILLAFVRDLITGPTPLHLISAPTEGTGKGLLADVGCIIAFGQHAAIMTEGRDADDWRKRVTSYLLMGHQAIQLDNLIRKLDAGSVAAALTSTTWTDRVLGGSTTARLPNTALWIATANNPNVSTEIARRCVRIRIDARSAHPNRRPASEFRHPDLRRWAHAHRAELVAACLTLVQAWRAAGRPVPVATLGSFESWAEVIGGVLSVAGIGGFLDNADEFFEQADTDGNGWRAFVAEWWATHNAGAVSVATLYPMYDGSDFGMDFGGETDKARRTRLGRAIGQQRDKVYGAWRITHAGTSHGIAQYRLESVENG